MNVCGNHYLCIGYSKLGFKDTSYNISDCMLKHKRNDLLWCPYDFQVTPAADVLVLKTLEKIAEIKNILI